jgi:hypothetical protein
MAITLENPARKLALSGVLALAALQFIVSARDLVAFHLAQGDELSHLRLAARLGPGNADYQYRIGKFLAFVQNDPAAALPAYRAAVSLNPHIARYWLDLAAVYQVAGDLSAQRQAIENAVRANPTNPDVAWEAGNFFLVQGDDDLAFRQFRVVLANQPNMAGLALQLCWRASPDVDSLLASVVPATTDANLAFLQLLMNKKDTDGAGKVWQRLVDLRRPFAIRHLFEYIKFLVAEQQVDQARMAWQQAATLLALNAYLPSNNLIVNPQFNEEVLNGGFDWIYQQQSGVTLTLDPTQFHAGHRSFSIVFDGAGIDDAGLYQLVPVEGNKAYVFSAFYKADEIQGAGGLVFAVRDFYSNQDYFTSEKLKDSGVWKQVEGAFTTAPDSRLLVVRIKRVPAGNAIRGRLWVDDFDLGLK